MPGIYIAATITVMLALALVSLVIVRQVQSLDRPFAILGVIISGGIYFCAFYLLRLPHDGILQLMAASHPGLYRLGVSSTLP